MCIYWYQTVKIWQSFTNQGVLHTSVTIHTYTGILFKQYHVVLVWIVCAFPLIQGVCDRLSDSVQTLESRLSEKEAYCEELEKKCYEEAQNCQLMEVLIHAFKCSKHVELCISRACSCVHQIYIVYIYVVCFPNPCGDFYFFIFDKPYFA